MHLLRDRILVLPDKVRDDVSAAGILIAASKGIVESQAQFGRCGTVIAVGDAVDQEQLKAGDRVLYGEFAFPECDHEGQKHIILQDADVCGVIE